MAEKIYHQARLAGYDDCGIIPIDEMDAYRDRFQERLEKEPTSRPFYERIAPGMETKERFPWAKAVVICTWWLGRYKLPPSLEGQYARAFFLAPAVSLTEEEKQKKESFTDWLTAEGIHWAGGEKSSHLQIGGLRHAAMKAGLGMIRKNNFLYTERGSFVMLEGFVIDQSCELRQHHDLKPCAFQCHLCQDHCPTGALSSPFTMNPLKCVSFWNTFGKSQLPPTLPEKAMGNWIVGCDACQNVCPYNRIPAAKAEKEVPAPITEALPWLAPERLKEAPDSVLQKEILPFCDNHIQAEEVDTLRLSAARYLRNQARP
ncbi:MAG: epoxyqueuosine reductase [Megasphaera sp.]|nr:epoxyqueuosine reductase [Megasphaera sp.]